MNKIIKFSLFFIIFGYTNFVSSIDYMNEESNSQLNKKLEDKIASLVNNKIKARVIGTLSKADIKDIKDFINAGADVNHKYNGYTALILSMMFKNTNLSQWLIKKGANINENSTKHTASGSPLQYAIIYNEDIIEYLIELGANINVLNMNKQNPLMLYISFMLDPMANTNDMIKRLNIIKLLIKEQKKVNIDINAKDKDNNTALHMLLQTTHNIYSSYIPDRIKDYITAVIKLLIKTGINPNIENNKNWHALKDKICANIWKTDFVFPIININNLPPEVNKIILDYI